MLRFKDFIVEDSSEEELDEVLSVQGRIKKRQNAMKYSGKLSAARRRWGMRKASSSRIGTRSTRGARIRTKQKFARGKKLSDLSYGQRASIEKRASTGQAKLRTKKLAMRLRPVKRRLDLGR